MLRIRLKRTGSKNNPTFRLVVAEKARSAKGKILENLGHFLPTRDPVEFVYDKERVEHWIKNGAAPSDTVARMLTNDGMKGLEKYIERYTKQKKRKESEEEPEVQAPAADAGGGDAAAEDKPAEEAPKEEQQKEEAPAEEPKEEEKPAEETKEEPKEEKKKEEEAPAEEASEDDKGDADS